MKNLFQKTLFSFAFLLFCISLFAQSKKAISAITALDIKRVEAMKSGNLETLADCCSDDLLFTHSNGKSEDKNGFLEAMKTGKYRFIAFDIQPLQYRIFRRNAIVHGKVHIDCYVFEGRYALDCLYTAVYVKKRRKWRLTAWQNTKIKE